MKKYLNLIGFLILIVIVFSCTIKDLEAPEFDKKIEFPLISQSYYMSDLADSTDDFIIVVENDTMMFSISNEFETKHVTEDDLKIDSQEITFESEIGDELTIDGRNEQTTVDVGDELVIDGQEREFERYVDRIEVEGTGDAEASILVLEFANEALGGGVGPIQGEVIPPFYDFPPFYQDFGIFANDNIEYVVIDTGTVYITFYNNTELPLSSDSGVQEQQMHFEFWTNGSAASHPDSIHMFTHYIDHVIEPGETEYMTLPFDGQTVYMENYLVCYLTSDGTTEPVNVDEYDSFDITFSVGDMTVSEASAILEAASLNHLDAISMTDDEIQVISAEIATCLGNIHIENNLPIDVDTLIIEFTELFDPSNQPFKIERTGLLSGDILDIPIDLQDCLIHSARDNPLDSLHFTLYSSSGSTHPEYVSITPEDKILTRIVFGEMSFSTVTGIINQESNEDGEIGLEDDTIELQSAVIREGTINISLTGLEIIPDSRVEILFDEIKDPNNNFEQLLLVIDDNFNNYVYDFAEHRIEFIPPNQTLHYHTTVILDQLITISNTDIVVADITLSDMIFEQIIGKFESFTIEDESSTVIDSTGEFSLFYAEINNCEVMIDISQNYTLPFDADINLIFNEIYTQAGIPLEISFHCPGDTTFNFAGYTVGHDPNSTIPIDTLHYTYSVITESTGEEYVPINYDDEVAATISIGNMVFQEVIGVIDNKEVDMEDIYEEIDMEDLPDSLQGLLEFQIVELHIEILNQVGFDCNLNMHLVGSNDEGESVAIDVSETILKETTTVIIIEDGVADLLNLIPTLITVTDIYATIGDGITPGSIALNDSIGGSYAVTTPLKFIIADHTITDRPDPIEMDESSQDAFENNINGIRLVINIENKFPFGADVKVCFATDSTQVFENPGLLIDSLFIEPAEIVEGVSGEPSFNEVVIDLSGDDFNVFLDPENQVVHIGAELSILGTNGVIVTIRGSDNIKIIGYLEADVHIAEPEE